MRTLAEKELAIKLRREGKSYREIRAIIPVSKSTLSDWVGNIELTEEQKDLLKQRSVTQGVLGGKAHQEIWDKRREKIKSEYVVPNDVGFALGLGIYWGEGHKHSLSAVGLTNCDPKVLKIFKRWIETYFVGDFDRFSVSVHHYYPERDLEIKKYWASELELSPKCFIKSQFEKSCRSFGKKGNTLTWGTVQVRVCGKGVWRIRQKIEKAFSYGDVAQLGERLVRNQ